MLHLDGGQGDSEGDLHSAGCSLVGMSFRASRSNSLELPRGSPVSPPPASPDHPDCCHGTAVCPIKILRLYEHSRTLLRHDAVGVLLFPECPNPSPDLRPEVFQDVRDWCRSACVAQTLNSVFLWTSEFFSRHLLIMEAQTSSSLVSVPSFKLRELLFNQLVGLKDRLHVPFFSSVLFCK